MSCVSNDDGIWVGLKTYLMPISRGNNDKALDFRWSCTHKASTIEAECQNEDINNPRQKTLDMTRCLYQFIDPKNREKKSFKALDFEMSMILEVRDPVRKCTVDSRPV